MYAIRSYYVLMVITAIFSALLDNVTTILLLGPVTILIAEQLDIDSIPFLISYNFV